MATARPPQPSEGEQYHPYDTLKETTYAGTITTTIGAVVSGMQNTMTRQNVGTFSMFTRTGTTVATFAATGTAYMFVKCASANLREKNDFWNPTYGGAAAGVMLGLPFRSFSRVVGFSVGIAATLAVFNYTGGKLSGSLQDPTVDEVGRKEYLRKNRRRPIEETISELGEGRGIFAPGYEERRKARIEARYGITPKPLEEAESPLAPSVSPTTSVVPG